MHARLIMLLTTAALIACHICGAAVLAQEQQSPGEEPPPIASGGRPEYTKKKLPNETFKPSEKISEDFPVPFPVDI